MIGEDYCCLEFARELDISIARYEDGTCYLEDMENGNPSAKLNYCPWCGTKLERREKGKKENNT